MFFGIFYRIWNFIPIFKVFHQFLISQSTDVPPPNPTAVPAATKSADTQKTAETPKPDETNKTRRRRHRSRRQATANSIEVENSENGKSTTAAPRAEESVQISKHDEESSIDRDSYVVFDGPLDPDSHYSGFIEVIGE